MRDLLCNLIEAIPDRIGVIFILALTNENFSTPTVLDLSVLSSLELLDPFGTVPVIRATVFGKCNYFYINLIHEF